MAEDVLTATRREEKGSAAVRRLRRAEQVPAVLYGKDVEPVLLALPVGDVWEVVRRGHHMVDVSVEGDIAKALVREVQYDTFGREILHVDLVHVSLTDKVRVTVPVTLRGTARGVDVGGGVQEQQLHELEVECLATALPDAIEARVSDLEVGGAIHVRDLVLPEGVVVLAEPGQVVVRVSAMVVSAEEEVAEEEAEGGPAEPEVITARKPEDKEEPQE